MKKAFETEDIQQLYAAFVSLCDYVEEEIGCGECPMWSKICSRQDKLKTENFCDALKRIRKAADIPNP